jgi:chromosome segregation ATPase
MPRQSSDDQDKHDPTDELPVLLETVAFEDAPLPEDTAQHAALYPARAEEPNQAAALRTDLAVRSAKIEELETEIARLKDRCGELEGQIAPKEASIRDLGRTLAAMRQSVEAHTATERQLAAQLAEREARLTELAGNDSRLRQELDELRATAVATEGNAARLEESLSPDGRAHAAMQELLEDNAALAAYIAGRRRWWDEIEAEQSALAARVTALEHELATSSALRERAETLAAQETRRATGLRAELVAIAHRLETAERDLARARRSEGELTPQPPTTAQPATEPVARSATTSAAEPATAATAARGVAGSAEPAVESAFEVIAQLEGQVEFKRQQVAAQLVELRDREHRLRAATTELERLRGELTAMRADLDHGKADMVRLERAVLDKDRALEARDARIATLQDELSQRLGALQKLNAMAPSLQAAAVKAPERSRGVEPNVESAPAPALICLTGGAPKRFALSKKHVTVGRGAHCDLQVLTHFVSREHARISLVGDQVLIEDLGSRNGVFVNSVRIDRQELRHGDLVTIGETQFRFVESRAH